ncbi:MAG TPA: serine/threonine-protein kinase [Prolixibacteraceae bacterium]|nr:serine/threonine-protein kinase [Prolixibacteraceae bacterium]
MDTFYTKANLDFKLVTRIGNGGEGEVYKAHDRQLNSVIAIKKVSVKSFIKESSYFEEAKKLYLTRHQNIVPVNYACKDDDFIYLAMPLYGNGSLKSQMDTRFLSSREIIRYSLQFLSGLNNIHTKKLLHFDIKPENILLSNSNQAVISDFGLAEYTGKYGFSKIHGTTQVLAPPELFSQQQHNVKFDIYQAGLTLYRMCVGDIVFFSQINEAHIIKGVSHPNNFIFNLMRGNFPDRSFYFSHIPIPLRRVITKALNPDIGVRYSTVIEFMNDIASIDNADDWIFETDYNSFEKWTKPNYELICTFANNVWEVVAKKTTTKRTAKKKEFCGSRLNNSGKNALTYRCLTSTW